MKFKLISNRMLSLDNKFAGYNNENRAELLEFEFPENLKDYTKTINFRTLEGNFFDILDSDTYTLKNNITKYDNVCFYIEFKKQISETEYEIIKTEIKTLIFNSSFNVDKEIPEEEINILDSLIIKIDEATKRANAISQDLEEKVANDYYRGPQGIQGIQGPIGPQGDTGSAGKNGVDGKSAYQVWLDSGNVGSEEDFLNSLVGPQGPKGETGLQGEIGPRGADGKDGISATHSWNGTVLTITSASGTSSSDLKGDKGDTGPQGIQGTAGQDGKNGIDGKNYSVEVVESTTTTLEIQPNKFYKFGEVTELNLTLSEITDTTQLNEFMFEFVSGATATTLTLPSTVKWLETPTIEANKTYQCSIVNNIGILVGVANV